MVKPMRQRHECPKCKHREILLARNITTKGILSVLPDTQAPFPLTGPGTVNAYVCRACGYTELYTLEPHRIPVDGVWVQALRGKSPDGPFR
jgi:predicted nucleic-acid-binding Zn-ribbon protein